MFDARQPGHAEGGAGKWRRKKQINDVVTRPGRLYIDPDVLLGKGFLVL